MGRNGRASVAAGLYRIVTKRNLWFSLLIFAAEFSTYPSCFGCQCICMWSYPLCGGAVLCCSKCLSSVSCVSAWVAMCLFHCTGLCNSCFVLLFVSS